MKKLHVDKKKLPEVSVIKTSSTAKANLILEEQSGNSEKKMLPDDKMVTDGDKKLVVGIQNHNEGSLPSDDGKSEDVCLNVAEGYTMLGTGIPKKNDESVISSMETKGPENEDAEGDLKLGTGLSKKNKGSVISSMQSKDPENKISNDAQG